MCLSLILALTVSACGGEPPTPPPTATPVEKQTLRIYTYDVFPMRNVLDIVSKAFEQSHPNVRILLEPITDDPARQLAALAAAGKVPDVVWTIDALTPSLVEAGLLLDMRELANVERDWRVSDIMPGALSSGNVPNNPGLYMIPAAMESVQMFYNKDLFANSGAPLPAADWTWSDLIAACQQIQDKNPGVTCISYTNDGMPDASWWGYLLPWIRGYGGDALSQDGKTSTLSCPESLAGITAYLELWTRHRVALASRQSGSCFVDQKCAVVFFIAGGVSALQERIGKLFNWDVQVIPAHPKGRYTGTATYGYGVARGTQQPELAWEFVKSLSSLEVQRAIAANRAGMPALTALANDPALIGSAPPDMQVFVRGIEFGIAPPAYPIHCGNLYFGRVMETLSRAFAEAMGGAKVEDAFQKADRVIQACMDGG